MSHTDHAERTYTKVVPFKEKSSFRFVLLWKRLEWNGIIKIDHIWQYASLLVQLKIKTLPFSHIGFHEPHWPRWGGIVGMLRELLYRYHPGVIFLVSHSVPFKEKSSFRFVLLWKRLEWNGIIKIDHWS
jgi:hypothetical protein